MLYFGALSSIRSSCNRRCPTNLYVPQSLYGFLYNRPYHDSTHRHCHVCLSHLILCIILNLILNFRFRSGITRPAITLQFQCHIRFKYILNIFYPIFIIQRTASDYALLNVTVNIKQLKPIINFDLILIKLIPTYFHIIAFCILFMAKCYNKLNLDLWINKRMLMICRRE